MRGVSWMCRGHVSRIREVKDSDLPADSHSMVNESALEAPSEVSL